jgi:transposase-like protein
VHKIANVLDAFPSSLQPKVKAALHNIMNAEDKEAADLAIDELQATYAAKYPKAVDKVLKDRWRWVNATPAQHRVKQELLAAFRRARAHRVSAPVKALPNTRWRWSPPSGRSGITAAGHEPLVVWPLPE